MILSEHSNDSLFIEWGRRSN